VPNGIEIVDGTNPLDPCDFDEMSQTLPVSTEWNELDCDGDGVPNGTEIAEGTDPFDPCSYVPTSQNLPPSPEWNELDCDGDGVPNGTEIEDGTNPLDLCDFEIGSQTLPPSGQWEDIDCDGDGVPNGTELEDETDPLNPCDFIPGSQTTQPDVSWELANCDCDNIPNGEENGDDNDNGIMDYFECNEGDPEAGDGLEIFDIMTPNGDGLNDVFVIRGIHKYPNNTVKIYNRWGVLVYETIGYGVNDNYFRGFSNGRVTITGTEQLPVGTYYFVLTYVNDAGEEKDLAGPIYINRK
jgi:gliding motility-associated-like protein